MEISNPVKKILTLSSLQILGVPLGFLNQLLISNYFGTERDIDLVWVALTIINSILFFIHPIREATIPDIQTANEIDKNKIFSQSLNVLLVAILSTGIFYLIFLDHISHFYAADHYQLLSYYLILLLPLFFFRSINDFLQYVLVSSGAYLFQNIGKIILAIVSITSLVFFADTFHVRAVILAQSVAPVIILIAMILVLYKANYRYFIKSSLSLSKPATKFFLFQVFIYLIGQFYPVIEKKIFYDFGVGYVSSMQYATTLVNLPLMIIVDAIIAVFWPRIISFIKNSDIRLHSEFMMTIGFSQILMVFVSIFIFFYSEEIVYLIFFRGKFDNESLAMTALFLRWFILSIPFLSANFLFGRVIFTKQKGKALTLVVIIHEIVKILALGFLSMYNDLNYFFTAYLLSYGLSTIGYFIVYQRILDEFRLGKSDFESVWYNVLNHLRSLLISKKLIRFFLLVIPFFIGMNIFVKTYLFPESIYTHPDKIFYIFSLTGTSIILLGFYFFSILIFKIVNISDLKAVIFSKFP